jgi:competence protein ComEC
MPTDDDDPRHDRRRARAAIPDAPEDAGGGLTDPVAVLLAVAVCLGAWWHRPVPLVVGLVPAVVAVVARRPWVLVVAGLALGSALGATAVAGLDPVAPERFAGTVTLVADPEELPWGTRVDVRVGERRVELEASGAAAGAVGRALAGERLVVSGRLRPPPRHAPWLVPRHVVGRLSVDRAEAGGAGSPPWRLANGFRRLLGRGAEGMAEPTRSLYGGFVLGDDRGQPPEVVDDFRGAGLTHLLVVSGQNVAFVLLLASPLTDRLALRWRWAATIGVIGAFGVLTRFEPSVLRASAMAAISVTAVAAGRPTASLRVLALAVAGLVLVDPLLVRSVGFQLSVGASLGIAVLGPSLAGWMRGPALLREGLGITLAAQAGVAPILIPRFGGIPVASIPANVLAVPVAGLVTTWGLPAGVVAGLAGGRVATVAHLPTRLLIAWVSAVARAAAALPLGELDGWGALVVAAGLAILVTARRREGSARAGRTRPTPTGAPGSRDVGSRVGRRPVVRTVGRVLAGSAIGWAALAPAWALRSPPFRSAVGTSAVLYRSGAATVLVVDGRTGVGPLMQDLRRAGTRRLDLVVTPADPAPDLIAGLHHRWPVGRAVARADLPASLRIGGLRIDPALDDAPPTVAAVGP